MMSSPKSAAASRQSRPVAAHHRRNRAILLAYFSVVDSARSLPNLSSRRYRSGTGTTAIASSSTVQYRAPDGICTENGRNRPPLRPHDSNKTQQNYTFRGPMRSRLAVSNRNITPRLRGPAGPRHRLGPEELAAVDGRGLTDIEMDLIVSLLDDYVRGAARGAAEAAEAQARTGMSQTSNGGKPTAPCSPRSSTRPATPQQSASAAPPAPNTTPLTTRPAPSGSDCSASSTASRPSLTQPPGEANLSGICSRLARRDGLEGRQDLVEQRQARASERACRRPDVYGVVLHAG